MATASVIGLVEESTQPSNLLGLARIQYIETDWREPVMPVVIVF